MKMLIDSANIEQIDACLSLGIFGGVTTNPTLLLREGIERDQQIKSILRLDIPQLFVQLVGNTAGEIIDDYAHLNINYNEQQRLAYKISINTEGLLAIKEIKKKDSEAIILGTAIYSAEQAMLAGLAGCDYVAPYVNRMLNNGISAFQVIEQINNFYKNQGLNCKIMGASFKNTNQVVQAYESGVQTVTLPTDVIQDMVERPLANDAIITFNKHAEQLN